jgi:hypothetical protein
MALADDRPLEEQATLEVATGLVATGNLHPLIARLRDGQLGPGSAREVLRTLGELDLDLLVQITLDGLIATKLEKPGPAHQPRRVVPGERSQPD